MVFVLAFAVYWYCLCPTVSFGDSGELITAAHFLGVPHPTGYPLYLLLLKAWTLLVPVGSIALRANLFSAVCAAGAAQVTACAVRPWVGHRLVAWAAGLTLAFAEPVFSQATIARTYSLVALQSATMLWLMLRWWQDGRRRWWYWHALVLGFALANHPMVAAHLVAFGVAALVRRGRGFWTLRSVLLGGLLLLPGLSVYAYVPLRGAADPVLEFRSPLQKAEGGYEFLEVETWRGFRAFLTREAHHGQRWVQEPGDYGAILGHHLWRVAQGLAYVGLVVLLLGVVEAWRRGAGGLVLALLALWLANLGPLAWHGAWWDIFLYPRYMTTGWVGIAFLVGLGLEFLAGLPAARRLGASAPVLTLALPLVVGLLALPVCNRREDRLAEDYARALLAELPQGAQFYSIEDNATYPIFYLHLVEGVRPDVHLVSDFMSLESLDETRTLFSPDPGVPFAGRGDYSKKITPPLWVNPPRRVLLHEFPPPGQAPTPVTGRVVPTLRGLDDWRHRDAIGRTMVAYLQATLAGVAGLMGDQEQAARRLAVVRAIPEVRPKGCFQAMDQLLEVASLNLRRNGDTALARAAMDEAARMWETARRVGDPRDEALASYGKVIEAYQRFVQMAEEAQQQEPGEGGKAPDPADR